MATVLDDQPLEGDVSIARAIGPERSLVLVYEDTTALRSLVRSRCDRWGGAGHLLLPVSSSGEADARWEHFRARLMADRIEAWEVSDDLVPKRSFIHTQPSALAYALYARPSGHALRPISVPECVEGSDWEIAYLAAFGFIGDRPEESLAKRSNLSEEFEYQEKVQILREPISQGSSADMVSRLHDPDVAFPTQLSLLHLEALGAPSNPTARSGISRRHGTARRVGSDIVVVYQPGSTEDLCLLWDLRAANGVRRGFPLGVPLTDHVQSDVRELDEGGLSRFGQNFSLERSKCLTSCSVDLETLEGVASDLGMSWSAAAPDQLLRASDPPARRSTTRATFSHGKAYVDPWSQRDREVLSRSDVAESLKIVVRLRPADSEIPRLAPLAEDIMSNGKYHDGAYVTGIAKRDDYHTEVRWPKGWTMVRALGMRAGLHAEPSPAGRAAVAFYRTLPGPLPTMPLAHPALLALLYRLGERSGMSWFRERVRNLIGEAESDDGQLDSGRIDEALSEIVAKADDADARSMSFGKLKSDLPLAQYQAESWLRWAERVDMLRRGAVVRCDRCHAKLWRDLSELSLPQHCDACRALIEFPYKGESLQFRYRGSPPLLRVLEHDALGHLLAMDWFFSIDPFNSLTPQLVGIHPGVSFFSGGTEIGEADLLLLFTDGTCAIIEYKRFGNGLNGEELAKLDRLADALDAEWTCVATHEFASDCGAAWEEAVQLGAGSRRRFAVTGDRLFQFSSYEPTLDDPFPWPTSDFDLDSIRLDDPSVWEAQRLDPDFWLHYDWDRDS